MRKRLIKCLAAVLTVAVVSAELIGAGSMKALAASSGTVNTSALNLRSGASTSTGILGVLSKGTTVQINGTSGMWYKVTVTVNGKSKSGYVHSNYVTVNSNSGSASVTGSGVVNVNGLNVRSGASLTSPVIGTVSSGAQVTVHEKIGDWYKVSLVLNGRSTNAYVFAQYVTMTGSSGGGSSSGSNTPAPSGTEGIVNTAALNVRSGASTSTTRIGCITKNTKVTILSVSGDWYKISTTINGKSITGYVFSTYITKTTSSGGTSGGGSSSGGTATESGTGKVNVYALNVRKSATTSSAVLATLKENTSVTIHEKTGDWYKITTIYNGVNINGYVFAEYITKTASGGNGGTSGGGSSSGGEVQTKTGVVNVYALNLRTGPSTSTAIAGSLVSGTQVTILETSGEWYKVQVLSNGRVVTGYVFAEYITVKADSSGGGSSGGSSGSNTSDGDFETMIAGFPESYKASLRTLHAKYPNWVFKPIQTGLNWNDVVEAESVFRINTTQVNIGSGTDFSQLSTASGAYDWATDRYTVCDGSNWYSASTGLIQYYLDPRNFLDEKYIFAFESLAYDSAQTKDVVQHILNDTFMRGSYTETDPSTGARATRSYADTFMEAGQLSGASPYYLAARARQELGVNGSNSSSGTYSKLPGYFNFYNIGASDGADAVLNGLRFASKTDPKYNLPWNTRYKSIVGGAKYISNFFINVGQNTPYFQKFNVVYKDKLYRNQYMTAVFGATSEAATVYGSYSKYGVLKDKLVFYIPVYNNMPASPCAKPAPSGNPNAYLSALKVKNNANGSNMLLTPTFNYATKNYDLIVYNSTTSVNVSATAVSRYAKGISGTGNYQLKEGANQIKVTCTAGNGTTTTYTINITRLGR